MISVHSTMAVPPGGLWFWEDESHAIAGPSFDGVVERVREVLLARGDRSDPVQAVLSFMAPRMPRGWAVGFTGDPLPTTHEYLERCRPLYARPVARVDEIMRRMETCSKCPARRVRGCMTCLHVPEEISNGFGGRRPVLPLDGKSGICECAGTFNMAVASVEYKPDEEVWSGTPSSCWRFTE